MLHPSYFGPRMKEFLTKKLHADVEGTCSGQFGYIITVIDVVNIGDGIVLPGSGQAEFITKYRAIVFKPFKGEVLDGVVNNVVRVRCDSFLLAHTCRSADVVCLGLIDGLLRGCRPVNRLRILAGALVCRPTLRHAPLTRSPSHTYSLFNQTCASTRARTHLNSRLKSRYAHAAARTIESCDTI